MIKQPSPRLALTAHVRAALQHASGKEWIDTTDLRLIDQLVARAHEARAGAQADADSLALVIAALCRACAEGGLCLPLNNEGLADVLRDFLSATGLPGDDSPDANARAKRFLADVDAGRLAAVLGTPGDPRPLMRAHGNIYFHRHWHALRQIADALRVRMTAKPGPDDAAREGRLAEVLRDTLTDNPLRPRGADAPPLQLAARQKWALVAALRERVFVLSGGPGTGKTTWTASWLRALLRLPGVSADRIHLCAPTGRAAQRLQESLRTNLPVTTLHTLLGYQPYTGRYARGPGDPLNADWVLVDEASMIDVFLLAALVRALPEDARLILVGDADQLPPVDSGSVLSELLPDDRAPRLSGTTRGVIASAFPDDADMTPVPEAGAPHDVPSVMLDVSHRASGDVVPLTAALLAGDANGVINMLGEPVSAENADAAFETGTRLARITAGATERAAKALATTLHAFADAAFLQRRVQGDTFTGWLTSFRKAPREDESRIVEILWTFVSAARVLAPLRQGTFSASGANRILRARLEPSWARRDDAPGTGFHGSPVLITRNDNVTGLSNGEIGLWLEAAGGATVFFPRPGLPGGWLRLQASQLPAHDPGFAVTVHKSQGSEYDEVLLILPEPGNRLLARETLYTAVTRARKAVRIYGTEEAIRQAVERRMRRYGGLREMMSAE